MPSSILTHWSLDPSVLVGLAALAVLYWRYARRGPPSRGRNAAFATMLALAFLALESPLDYVADHYLFSAHMVQHLALVLGVAPLLAVSVPPVLAEEGRRRLPGWITRAATQPVL